MFVCKNIGQQSLHRMLWWHLFILVCSFGGVFTSRVQSQNQISAVNAVNAFQEVQGVQGLNSTGLHATSLSYTGCRQGMHIQLDKTLSDKHVINPNANDDEQQHFVLTKRLAVGESESGLCSELVRGPPLFGSSDELWEVDDSHSLFFLHGSIEATCDANPNGKPSLRISQFSCREFLPFSTIWKLDSEPAATRLGPENPSKYEYAEFTCSNPLMESVSLLHVGTSNVLKVVSDLAEAQTACDADPDCQAIAVKESQDSGTGSSKRGTGKGGRKNFQSFHLLDSFNCRPAKEAFHSSFVAGEMVMLRFLAHSQQGLDHERNGKVLESWSLEDAEADVLVQFASGTQYIMAEHLAKENEYTSSSWAVLRKIRERKAVCEDLTEHWSCDIYSKAKAEKLDAATPSSCRQTCLERMQAAPHLNRCCVLADDVCALTSGEHFHLSDEEEILGLPEWAGSCYQDPCSIDPMCTFGKGKLPDAPEASAAGTVFFDFANPLTLPFSIDQATGLIYHFASEDPILQAALKDKKRLVRSVGQIVETEKSAARKGFGKLPGGLRRSSKEAIASFQQGLAETCESFGHSIGRRLLAPNLEEALASDECELHKARHSLESCLVKAGCHAQSKEDVEHADWLPFSPLEFAQLPYDLLAWQTPAAFCCSPAYTSDERQEHMVKTLLEKADMEGVNLDHVDDASVRANLKKSIKSGSSALKKMLAHHISDEAELSWLGDMVRLARGELKGMLADLQDTVDAEGSESDVEIKEDGTAFLQVAEGGDQVAPSGRPAFVIAQWSPEKGAFLQTDPNSTKAPSKLRQAWNLISSVPGAVYQYGVKPLWNYVAKPLLRWGLSLMKWILEHPRAALFISKFAVIIKDRLCEKASWYLYGDPDVSAVGAFAYASKAGKESAT